MNPLARAGSRIARAFESLSTGGRLAAAFSAVLLLTAAVGAVGLVSLARVASQAQDLSHKWMPGVEQLATAKAAALDARDHEVKHSRTSDKSYHAEYEDKMAAAAKSVDSALAAYEPLVRSDAERQLAEGLHKAWGAYRQSQQRVVELGRSGKQQDAADISDGASSSAAEDVLSSIDKLWAYNVSGSAGSSQQADATYALALKMMTALLTAALLTGAVVALLFTRALLRSLGGEPRLAAQVAQAVAAGDLTTSIPVRPGDVSSLMAQLHAMQKSLGDAVSTVRGSSERVAAASEQIAQGNNDLSQRTDEQSQALQTTAGTMEQLGATVRNNASNAQQANQLARGASQVATEGGDVVGQVVETMKGIQDASRRIGDIISVIDGIAFQTNILALNAAVEAARAGEQGRGFAVVAGEVRNLAQRSAEAAREIKVLIGTSVERVEQGTELVDRAGSKMQEVVQAIRRVSDIVGEISTASSEQSAGVEQVGRAVQEMDRATQQNAALVVQSASAASSLRTEAGELVRSVAVFRLAGDGTRGATPVVRAAPPAVERRGPQRATNVTRPAFGAATRPAAAPAPAKTGTDDWDTF